MVAISDMYVNCCYTLWWQFYSTKTDASCDPHEPIITYNTSDQIFLRNRRGSWGYNQLLHRVMRDKRNFGADLMRNEPFVINLW